MSIFLESSRFSTQAIQVEGEQYSERYGFIEAGYAAIIEAQENWTELMKSIAIAEAEELRATGDVVTESGAIVSFLVSAKDWLVAVFKKIKGLFEKFIAKIMSLVSSDKAFIDKYETKIREGASRAPSSLSFKGYKFTLPDTVPLPQDKELELSKSDFMGHSKEDLAKRRDGIEKFADNYRGKICGGSSVTQGEFVKELKDKWMGDKETLDKSDITGSDIVGKMISSIKSAKEDKDAAKRTFDELKGIINKNIANMDKLIKDSEDLQKGEDGDKSDEMSVAIAFMRLHTDKVRQTWSINTIMYSTFLECLKTRNRQYKAVCVKLVGYASRTD